MVLIDSWFRAGSALTGTTRPASPRERISKCLSLVIVSKQADTYELRFQEVVSLNTSSVSKPSAVQPEAQVQVLLKNKYSTDLVH
jgi:hypothetical protein